MEAVLGPLCREPTAEGSVEEDLAVTTSPSQGGGGPGGDPQPGGGGGSYPKPPPGLHGDELGKITLSTRLFEEKTAREKTYQYNGLPRSTWSIMALRHV